MKIFFWLLTASIGSIVSNTERQDAKADALIMEMIQFGRSIDGFEARFSYQTFGPNQSGNMQEGTIKIYH
ncbi:MAG: hypothetical protein AAF399_04640 [Bacteroidota bacterium]